MCILKYGKALQMIILRPLLEGLREDRVAHSKKLPDSPPMIGIPGATCHRPYDL